jgi:hypothetical protein
MASVPHELDGEMESDADAEADADALSSTKDARTGTTPCSIVISNRKPVISSAVRIEERIIVIVTQSCSTLWSSLLLEVGVAVVHD